MCEAKAFRIMASADARFAEQQQPIALSLDSTIAHDAESGIISLSDSRIDVASLFTQVLTVKVAAGSVSPRTSRSDIPAFQLSIANHTLDGALATDWSSADDLEASGTLAMKDVDTVELLSLLSIEAPEGINPDALKRVSLSSDYKLSGDRLDLNNVSLHAGTFDAALTMRVDLARKSLLNASLSSPDLDIDYLFPPDPEKKIENPEAESESLGSLLDLDGNFHARIDRLHNAAWDLRDVEARLNLEKKHARLERLTATLYGGTLNASGAVDARSGPGTLQANLRLKGVDLKQLLISAQKIDNLEGRIDTTVDLHARGLNSKSWTDTLSGPIQVHVDQPVLRDISMEELICTSAAKLNAAKPSRKFPPYTQLGSIDTTMDFNEGNGTFRNLSLLMSTIAIAGKGNVDLADRKLNIKLNARIVQDLGTLDPACRTPKKMMAVEWPVTCRGSFDDDPAKLCGIKPDDMAKIATQLAKGRLENTLKKGLDKFFDRD
jgi:AsmA protein